MATDEVYGHTYIMPDGTVYNMHDKQFSDCPQKGHAIRCYLSEPDHPWASSYEPTLSIHLSVDKSTAKEAVSKARLHPELRQNLERMLESDDKCYYTTKLSKDLADWFSNGKVYSMPPL